jgi:hypothetical protein
MAPTADKARKTYARVTSQIDRSSDPANDSSKAGVALNRTTPATATFRITGATLPGQHFSRPREWVNVRTIRGYSSWGSSSPAFAQPLDDRSLSSPYLGGAQKQQAANSGRAATDWTREEQK